MGDIEFRQDGKYLEVYEDGVAVVLMSAVTAADILKTHLRISSKAQEPEFASYKAMLARGNVIGAIKEYRARTGCSLQEAKAAIDALNAHKL